MTTRYVIIGSGVAGMAAAEAIRTADHAGEITMISNDPYGYYSRPGLAYLLTGEIPQAQLFPLREADWRALGVHRVTAKVTQLEPAAHRAVLADGRPLFYDRLLLATGSTAARLTVPGATCRRWSRSTR